MNLRKLKGHKTAQVSVQASKNNSNNSSVRKIIPSIKKSGILNQDNFLVKKKDSICSSLSNFSHIIKKDFQINFQNSAKVDNFNLYNI
jgi:hypothetical protein